MKPFSKPFSSWQDEQARRVGPGRAHLDLLSLSWGRCGRDARLPHLRGWTYAFVHRDARMLQLATGAVRVPAGQLVIVDPACACGWSEASPGVSELLTWLWGSAPRCAECAPPPGGFRLFPVEAPLRQKLKQLHFLCRAEVEHPDGLTKLELEQVRLQLDLAIARSQRPKLHPPETDLRLQFVLRWLAQNLDEPKPVAALCEYLQISQVTLNRLFRIRLRESVATYYHRLKMERARDWLASGHVAVKEVSFALGYQHPNDFSRAFKQFTGHTPRQSGQSAARLESQSTNGDKERAARRERKHRRPRA
jgi:AraC-like DNA-binding protein